MSDFTEIFDLALPAGNGVIIPVIYKTTIQVSDAQLIIVTFPPGCSGLVGAQIWLGGNTVYPKSSSNYFVFDDFSYEQPVKNKPNSGSWAINAYNADFLVHTLQVVIQADYPTTAPNLLTASPVSL